MELEGDHRLGAAGHVLVLALDQPECPHVDRRGGSGHPIGRGQRMADVDESPIITPVVQVVLNINTRIKPGFLNQLLCERQESFFRHCNEGGEHVRLMLPALFRRPELAIGDRGPDGGFPAGNPGVRREHLRQETDLAIVPAKNLGMHGEVATLMENGEVAEALLALLQDGVVDQDRIGGNRDIPDTHVPPIKNRDNVVVEYRGSGDGGLPLLIENVLVIHGGSQVAFHKMEGVDSRGLLQEGGLIVPNKGFCILLDLHVGDDRVFVAVSCATAKFNHSFYLFSR